MAPDDIAARRFLAGSVDVRRQEPRVKWELVVLESAFQRSYPPLADGDVALILSRGEGFRGDAHAAPGKGKAGEHLEVLLAKVKLVFVHGGNVKNTCRPTSWQKHECVGQGSAFITFA